MPKVRLLMVVRLCGIKSGLGYTLELHLSSTVDEMSSTVDEMAASACRMCCSRIEGVRPWHLCGLQCLSSSFLLWQRPQGRSTVPSHWQAQP